ncbi:MAG: hypothetical protein ACR2OY_03380 [Boseongicola sp.]
MKQFSADASFKDRRNLAKIFAIEFAYWKRILSSHAVIRSHPNLAESFAMRNFYSAAACCLFFGLATSATSAPKPVELTPINHREAQLEIRIGDGSRSAYAPADLEAFPTYQIETTTPWRETPAIFEGILLTDLLEAHGLLDAPSIRVTAENDFTTVIDQEVWQAAPILVATRVDGRPHSRRDRGPIQFVVASEDYVGSPVVTEDHLVWMAAVIEVGN